MEQMNGNGIKYDLFVQFVLGSWGLGNYIEPHSTFEKHDPHAIRMIFVGERGELPFHLSDPNTTARSAPRWCCAVPG